MKSQSVRGRLTLCCVAIRGRDFHCTEQLLDGTEIEETRGFVEGEESFIRRRRMDILQMEG